nr:MAG TPA: hypothetical protein [Caudoviricetes sp.]
MLNSMEYLGLPTTIIIIVVAVFLVIQCIGELIEFKGKAVPEFFNIRKYFARKKAEREILSSLPDTIKEMKKIVDNINRHYSEDNISKRDKWIDGVNKKLDANDELIRQLSEKIDKNNKDTLSLLIESKRTAIIDFASKVSNTDAPITKEYYNRIFKMYQEYEDIISKNDLTNGEVDIAYRIIVESYEEHLSNHTFIEDIRGW